MKRPQFPKTVSMIAVAIAFAATSASAAEVRVMCYQDGNECDVTKELAKRFEADNKDVTVIVDTVPYKAITEQLPVQLGAGEGPDIARVTDLGGLNRFYLDITPYVKDAKYWEANFGKALAWLRATPSDKGIYGLQSQLTITGPFVNKTLFEQAKVAMPGPKATWDDWVVASKAVAKATQTPFAMAWDRSGHRFAGPAISYGAKLFDAKGDLVIVDGYKAISKKFVDWNKDGTMPKEVWGGTGGSSYRDAFDEFKNGRVVMYLSGSWQVKRMESQIGKSFDWIAVPNPCGPAACTGIPGGAAFVALKRTKAPKDVGRFLDYLSQDAVYAEMMAKTNNLPANTAVAAKGVSYDVGPAAKAALNVFVAEVPKLSPVAYQIQGYKLNRAIFLNTVTRLSQSIVGEMSTDDAIGRLTKDIDEAVKASSK